MPPHTFGSDLRATSPEYGGEDHDPLASRALYQPSDQVPVYHPIVAGMDSEMRRGAQKSMQDPGRCGVPRTHVELRLLTGTK